MGNSNNGTEVGTLRTVSLINSNTNGSYALNGKIMLCTVVILFFTVFLILGFHTYARWFFHGRRRRRSRRLLTSAADGDPAGTGGLDAAALKSLPTFTFAAKHQPNISDCAVCLSDFEIGESGRVLPGCGHCFHTECIDMWFGSHSSCPLCRAPVRVGREPVKKVPEPAGNSSAELVGIIVEVPHSMEERYIRTMATATAAESGSGSPGCNRAKSPDNRVLSMKRIWSI